jgi:hypothetical protein
MVVPYHTYYYYGRWVYIVNFMRPAPGREKDADSRAAGHLSTDINRCLLLMKAGRCRSLSPSELPFHLGMYESGGGVEFSETPVSTTNHEGLKP